MNVDPQTFILFSLGVDLILCAVLVFLWLRHSDERHAFAWAIGQFPWAPAPRCGSWGRTTGRAAR